ncbi:hypothetical protein ACOMHN_000610 [Nucella lapillus]
MGDAGAKTGGPKTRDFLHATSLARSDYSQCFTLRLKAQSRWTLDSFLSWSDLPEAAELCKGLLPREAVDGAVDYA